MKNSTISFFIIKNFNINSPLLINQYYKLNLNFIKINNNFNTFLYSSKSNFYLKNSNFKNFLSPILYFSNNNYFNQCYDRISPSSISIFNTNFCSILSNSNGGACYFNLENSSIKIEKSIFQNCSAPNHYGGGFFISSLCFSIKINFVCFFFCLAKQSHAFRIECSNSQLYQYSIFKSCSYNYGLYGSQYISKKTLITDLNSTFNYMEYHGAGFYLYGDHNNEIFRSLITQCNGKGIETTAYSGNNLFNYHNIINNTCISDGIIDCDSNLFSNWKNCIFFYNKGNFWRGKPIFSDCKFDINYFIGPSWGTNNMFNQNSFTIFQLDLNCFKIHSNSLNFLNIKKFLYILIFINY